jgi:hypothetical protein
MRGAAPRRGDFRSPSAGRAGWFLAGAAPSMILRPWTAEGVRERLQFQSITVRLRRFLPWLSSGHAS